MSHARRVAPENFEGKRLVVFGAGYVGGDLAREASSLGLRVTALTRNAEKAEALRAQGVEVVVADLADTGWHAHPALASVTGQGIDFAVNCVSSGGGGSEGYRRSYVEGMRSVVAWVEGEKVGTFVYTSSTSVYPQGGGARVDENSPTEGVSGNAAILLEAERLAFSLAGRDGRDGNGESGGAGPRVFVLRLAGIYGQGRHHLLDQLREGAGVVAGRGDHRLNLIHRDDATGAIWKALTSPPEVTGGIFNAADDGAAPKAEVMGWLAARIGVKAPTFSGEPAAGRRGVTPDRVIVSNRARSVLGWRPVYPTFREGYAAILGA